MALATANPGSRWQGSVMFLRGCVLVLLLGLLSGPAWAQALIGLRIDGPDQVKENTLTYYRVVASFDNGQEYDVTLSSYLWLVPGDYAQISLFGDFVVAEVPAVQVETIWAYYAFGADAELASLPVTIENIFNVLSADPAPDSVLLAPPSAIVVELSEPADPNTVHTSTCRLVRSVDGVFGNGDDSDITLPAVQLTDPMHITVDVGALPLPDDVYQVTVLGSQRLSALAFDGVNDYVQLPPDAGYYSTTGFTWEMWVKLRRIRTSRFLAAGDGASGQDIAIGLQGTRFDFQLEGPGVSYRILYDVPGGIQLDKWYHVAAVADYPNERAWLYVNGDPIEGVWHGDPIGRTMNFILGRFDDGAGWIRDPTDGDMNDVRVWHVVRTEEEIRREMHRTLAGTEPGLFAYWGLDEGEGQMVHDLSQYGHDGRLGVNNASVGDDSDPRWVASNVPIQGVRDLDGNVVDGEFDGTFPSGDATPGGDFVYQFTIDRPPATLVATDPPADGTLPKVANNVLRLTFDRSLFLLPAGPALSIKPVAGGADVAGSFTYALGGDGSVLQASENGEVLINLVWYRVTPAPALDVNPFVLDLCTLRGDADGTGQVLAGDYFPVKNHLFENTDARYDLDASGQVLASDYFIVKNHLFHAKPPKP